MNLDLKSVFCLGTQYIHVPYTTYCTICPCPMGHWLYNIPMAHTPSLIQCIWANSPSMVHELYNVFGEYPIPTMHTLYNTFSLTHNPIPRTYVKGDHSYISQYFTSDSFLPCNLWKIIFSYFSPSIPPVYFSFSINPMPWLFILHLFSPHLPDPSHVSEDLNYPFHLSHNNLSLHSTFVLWPLL